MLFTPQMTSNLLGAGIAALCLLFTPASHAESAASKHAGQVDAEFRGCEAAGWCRFWIDSPGSLIRVRPHGVPQGPENGATSITVRNRLNALLSNMIHQAKHIELHDLHQLEDGTFTAMVTVTGVNLATDPILVKLRDEANATAR
jgi:hypothetical protein